VEHRSHDYVFLQHAAQRARTRIQQSLESLKLHTATLSGDKSQCEINSTRISELKSLLQSRINGKITSLLDNLKARQDQLLERVEELFNKKEEENLSRLIHLEEILRTNTECTTFVERSLSSRDADFIRLDHFLFQRIEELLLISAPSPLSKEELSFTLDMNAESLNKEIKMFGAVNEIPQSLPKEELQEELVHRGFLFYFLLLVFVLCHCVPVFVEISNHHM
jgi:hypothetical protein